jgi:hypothetical protein
MSFACRVGLAIGNPFKWRSWLLSSFRKVQQHSASSLLCEEHRRFARWSHRLQTGEDELKVDPKVNHALHNSYGVDCRAFFFSDHQSIST